jgi:hypothetical protein
MHITIGSLATDHLNAYPRRLAEHFLVGLELAKAVRP